MAFPAYVPSGSRAITKIILFFNKLMETEMSLCNTSICDALYTLLAALQMLLDLSMARDERENAGPAISSCPQDSYPWSKVWAAMKTVL